MPICSYCDQDKAATREHIIPSWYYQHDPSPDDVGFMERAKGKIVKTELVIRDVCGDCNNGSLSELDAYGKELFLSHLARYVFKDSSESLCYDYERLVRWLLKISYNSARAHDSDTEILAQYKKIILGEQALPASVILRLRTIAPATHGVYAVFPANKDSVIADRPAWFRVGVFRVKKFDSMYWAFRHITINSYSFLLYVPDLSSSHASSEADSLMSAVAAENDGSILINSTGRLVVPEPRIDSISFNMNHIGQFPITYKVVESNVIKTALDNQFGLVNYWIDRKDIEEQNISNALAFLNDLTSSREVCMGLKERLELSVHGYNDDSREIYEIPEVIAFLRALNEAWPYWMLFQHPEFTWLQVMAVCLCSPTRTKDGKVAFDHEEMSELMTKWFCSLNELCHKFAISLTVNKRVSAQAQSILTKGLV
ncbi:hypothetical protein [Chitinimonas sp. BJYL2]|uniref:hypothetical protein n=1 Tax=Chitinimonas sp. BJYL2 TaxID=2976696 RepID=UPI0022B49DFE|nr:hypothetical protein [Chitinimonas sp. BJYL2]